MLPFLVTASVAWLVFDWFQDDDAFPKKKRRK